MKRVWSLVRRHALPLIIVSGALVLVSVILWQTSRLSTNTDINCPPEDMRCYSKQYALWTYYQTPEVAFTKLEAAYKADPFIATQCHQLSHIVGRTAYKRYTDLTTVFGHGNSFCWSGYYHGVIEQAVGDMGAAAVKRDADKLCSTFADKQQFSFDHFNCVHGLGHGLMSIEGYDLFKALDDCDLLTGPWQQSSCQGGVYMENVMVAVRESGNTKYLKKDDLLYPCNAVEKRFKEQCYLMQTSYALKENSYDFDATFKLCAQADAGFVNTCYQSLGRDASGSTNSNQSETIATCQLSANPDGIYNCMVGAVKDFVSYYHSDQQALALCDGFGGSITEPCQKIVKDYYASF